MRKIANFGGFDIIQIIATKPRKVFFFSSSEALVATFFICANFRRDI